MTILDDIDGYSAYVLAGMANCLSPDTLTSPGALLLEEVRDGVTNAIREGRITLDDFNDSGQLHEICDDAPSIYTGVLWEQFADLGAYLEEPESGEWPQDLTEVAGIALYQICDRLAWAVCQEWRDGWQCPICGDTGEPLLCSQEECYGQPDSDAEAPDDSDASKVSESTRETAQAVLTGPVDLPAVSDPILDLIREHESAQVAAETESDMRRVDAMRIGHEQQVKADRVMVWTVAAILAMVTVVLIVGGLG